MNGRFQIHPIPLHQIRPGRLPRPPTPAGSAPFPIQYDGVRQRVRGRGRLRPCEALRSPRINMGRAPRTPMKEVGQLRPRWIHMTGLRNLSPLGGYSKEAGMLGNNRSHLLACARIISRLAYEERTRRHVTSRNLISYRASTQPVL